MRDRLWRALLRCGVELHRPAAVSAANALRYRWGRRIPWSGGYQDYKASFLTTIMRDEELRGRFRSGGPLPTGYGIGLDERCVELPWFFSQAADDAIEYLDAGATLNHAFLVRHPYWEGKRLTIVTLAPEDECFWRQGVSYQFADLRALPFRDEWFDEIACLSTLEHVGMDNAFYSTAERARPSSPGDFAKALGELRRVLRPRGRLLLSVPFGRYRNWQVFQQFDGPLLDRAAEMFGTRDRVETFYRYDHGGWQVARREQCEQCEFSEYMLSRWIPGMPARRPESDRAAAARAVACCVWERA